MRVPLINLLVNYNNEKLNNAIKECKKTLQARDEYIPSNLTEICTYSKHQYSKCSDESLDYINFHYAEIWEKKNETLNSIRVGNEEYLISNLPAVDEKKCKQIKAVNNKVIFSNENYYKYTDKKGNTHVLSCLNDDISQPYSYLITGRQNDATYHLTLFWNLLSTDGTYLGLYFSEEEQRNYLNDAGIKEGFFTIQVGNNKREYYYSNGNAGIAVSKEQYDGLYNLLKNGSPIMDDFEVGSVFRIGEKEYILSENRTLDIPYGEDIEAMEWPLLWQTKEHQSDP